MAMLQLKSDSYTQCLLCPNKCHLNSTHEYGACGIRKYAAENGDIVNPYSGILSGEALDPIEKKPLFHFLPGSEIYSIGFYGCTLKCKFCQNYTISQTKPPAGMKRIAPGDLVDMLEHNKFKSIAFTYSEPLLYYEWVLETAKLAKTRGIKTVLVTNGFINHEPGEEILNYIDAVNVDLKSYSESFYKTMVGGSIEPVKDFILLSYRKKVHTEVTTLIIPGHNDSTEEMERLTGFLSGISSDIPFHITGYHPAYKLTIPPTTPESILKLSEVAREKMKFVYNGNVGLDNDTLCKKCRSILVKRSFYDVKVTGLDEKGKCSHCGENNYFVL